MQDFRATVQRLLSNCEDFQSTLIDGSLQDSRSCDYLVDPLKFFQVVRDDGRRGHIASSCYREGTGLDVGRFKFANRVCEEWNGLDDNVVAVGSVNAFMSKLDHHLRNMRGYF